MQGVVNHTYIIEIVSLAYFEMTQKQSVVIMQCVASF